MKVFKMLIVCNGRITFYQDFRNIGLSLTIGGENRLVDNNLLLHIQVLFWEIEIYIFKESEETK